MKCIRNISPVKSKIKVSVLFSFLLLVLFSSCYKPGKIKVKNNLPNVTISNVQWGGNIVANSLYPTEVSNAVTIDKYDEKLPATHTVTFIMYSNNRLVYLETEEEYSLTEDEEILIELSDSTRVK